MLKPTEGVDIEEFVPEEEPVHSLPTAEEVKTQTAVTVSTADNEDKPSGGQKRKCAICVVAICVIALIISLSVYFYKKTGGDTNYSMTPEERLSKSRAYLSTFSIEGSDEALADKNSPQNRALAWLARDDPLQLEIPDPEDEFSSSGDSESEDEITFEEVSKEFMNRYIMAVLYFSTNGTTWEHDFNFLSERPTCRWMTPFQNRQGVQFALGVTCDTEGNIITVWLPNNKMNGELPLAELSQLTYLTVLGFELNEGLTGSIPDSISQLTNLEVLTLSNNKISETLPDSMQEMTSLKTITLDDNLLSGKITSIIGLPNLLIVYLEDNFFDGQIDNSYFSEATELIHLDLSDNEFSGQIPAQWFEKANLQVLDMHGNLFLDGTIPDIPAEQTALQVLALHENAFTGEIPPSISNLRSLTHLDVSNNALSGPITDEIGKLTDLDYLFLGMNNYDETTIPSFLRSLTKLTDLSLKKMNLVGEIPEWIGTDLESLRLLDLDGNRLNGSIPATLTELKSLIFLLLNRNELTGFVPPGFRDVGLELLLLDHNSLIGDLDVICQEEDWNPADLIIADCGGENPEVTCTLSSCCSTCCNDADENCNEEDWLGNKDPIWENSYQRYYYSFDDIIAWIPVDIGF